MRLLLIRHAQSANNALYAQQGTREGYSPDPALSELGHQQAKALAAFARHDATFAEVTALYCSLTTRAVQTAAPLATALGLSVQGLHHAHETEGLYITDAEGQKTATQGRTHADLLGECPKLIWPPHLPPQQPWDGGFEAKDPVIYRQRAAAVLGELQGRHSSEETVALVTHGHWSQFLLAEALQATTPQPPMLFSLDNTATTFIRLGNTSGRVFWVNRQDHLPAPLRTI